MFRRHRFVPWLIAMALILAASPPARSEGGPPDDPAVLPEIWRSACPRSRGPVRVDDPRLARLWEAAAVFGRARQGFSPLPVTGDVVFEHRPDEGAAVIHTCQRSDRAYRTIHFRLAQGSVRWIGEQQSFRSGRNFEDRYAGTLQEEIVLDYEIEPVAGFPLNQLNILYRGPATGRGGPPASPSQEEARRLLREWGF